MEINRVIAAGDIDTKGYKNGIQTRIYYEKRSADVGGN